MYRIQADQMIRDINVVTYGMADGNDRMKIIEQLEKNSKGLHGILEEVRNIKNVKH